MTYCSSIARWQRVGPWCLVALLAVCAPSPVRSQPTAGRSSRHGGAIAGGFGSVSDSSGTAPAVSGSVDWELVPQLALDGRGTWLGNRAGATGFGTMFSVRATLPPHRLVPFLAGGGGVFHAAFDGAAAMPACYRGRVAADGTGASARYVFNDLAYSLGAGADVFLTSHVAVRPEVTVLLVRVDGRTHPVWIIGSQLAYHAKSHLP